MQAINKRVGYWLWLGVAMIFVQVVLGGITRLTGSGLSITEWNVLMGTLPPLSESRWQQLFDQYQQFPQYHLMNSDMTLGGFKSIFWWEYLHRLWARLFAVVFLVPYLYFVIANKISLRLKVELALLFVFGALQGLVGWVMVQSGLVNQPWVDPLKLTLHLLLALLLFAMLLRIAVRYTSQTHEPLHLHGLTFGLDALILLAFMQIFFGGLMAGHHAALFFPTWPKIGSAWIPDSINSMHPAWINLLQNKATIQFMHRNLAYLIAILIFGWWLIERKRSGSRTFNTLKHLLPVAVLVQITLGILTLINSLGSIPVVLGVMHQAGAVALLTVLLVLRYRLGMARQRLRDQTAASASVIA